MIATSQWVDRAVLRGFETEGTDAHRLCTTTAGWVERFGRDILISFQTETERERLTDDFFGWAKSMQLDFDRIFGRLLPRKNEERVRPRLLFGNSNPDLQSVVTERKLKFGIDFAAGYSVGLFLDQRENRSHLRKLAPKRLLNCFAYTCSFSVAAAAAGSDTVSIDLSKKSLTRGKENFRLNDFNAGQHRFIADDVRPVLRRFDRRGERFDAIILDPPTFSKSRAGNSFRVERDFAELLSAALQVADRHAHILLSTNCATLDGKNLELIGRSGLKQVKKTASFQPTPPPIDFPAGAGASSVWLSLR
jgi:23S rRNA (cytosine1962-C5)-methyltransferase